jgi:CheY-like chemotaxis protein
VPAGVERDYSRPSVAAKLRCSEDVVFLSCLIIEEAVDPTIHEHHCGRYWSATAASLHLSAIAQGLCRSQNTDSHTAPIMSTIVRKNTQNKRIQKRRGHVEKEKPLKTLEQTVLVVDDDVSALSAIARLIRSAGFKVKEFSHPKALLREELPSRNACLVADIYLPEMNGVELCNALAVTGHALPTILITGRDDETTRRLCEDLGAIAVLFKPIDEVPLLAAISQCLTLSAGPPDEV